MGGSGFDHLAPWDADRITVTNGAGVLAPYLAESVTGAMLALACGFPGYAEQQRARRWRPVPFTPLRGRTLLVAGFGHIGECVARNAKALGMRVLATRATPAPHPAADAVQGPGALAALLPEADFVSLHVRLDAATRGLLSREAIAAMKPGAYLINTSRGAVVDEAALIDALRSGHLGGAYLDVFETEPLPAESPLWSMPNVILTPHASDTSSAGRAGSRSSSPTTSSAGGRRAAPQPRHALSAAPSLSTRHPCSGLPPRGRDLAALGRAKARCGRSPHRLGRAIETSGRNAPQSSRTGRGR